MASAPPMRIVVAICTWNRCELLRQTLEGLKALVIPADVTWEVLVVNNNCTDATDSVVAEFTRMLPVRLVHEQVPGLSNARNRALRESRADYIVFTDDDVQVESGWLHAFVEAARTWPAAAVFGGPVHPWFPVLPDPELFEAFPAIRNGFCGIDHRRLLGPLPSPLRLTGANMAFKLDTLGTLQFDPALGVNQASLGGSEETAYITALRARGEEVVWVPSMLLRHYVDPARMQLGYLIRLARDRGRSAVREKGVPRAAKIAGAPVRFWVRLATASVRAGRAYLSGHRIRAAGHFATAEAARAKISECWAVRRRAGLHRRGHEVSR
ncbi:MAG: glycosyltransferase [Acidobacteria bacterium]|nr:glycosyltransferase [Acidobacteriota bacterium]